MSTITRKRIDLRVEAETKQLAERASAALGCSSLTEFVVRLIQDHAPKILQEQANIELSNAQFDRFIEVCNAQHTVPPRLKQAAELLDKESF